MAIGTTAAILGAAVIGAGASALSAGSQRSAARSAENTARDNTAANNALSREMYGNNVALLEPFRQQGLAASRTLNELLLGPSAGPAPAPVATLPAPAVQPGSVRPMTPADYGGVEPNFSTNPFARRIQMRSIGWDESGALGALRGMPQGGAGRDAMLGDVVAPAGTPTPTGTVTTPARTAFDTFRDSTNYQFRLNEGTRALNQGYAANGTLQSGAALRALTRYGQDMASNELGTYMDRLAGQQNMGMGAASAVAGVGQNMTGQIISSNNSGASAAANAALARGQASADMINGIGGSMGRALGALGGSSYGR